MAFPIESQDTAPATVKLEDRVRSLRLPDPAPRRASGTSWFVWGLLLFFMGTTGYLGYLQFGKPRAADMPTANPAETTITSGDVKTPQTETNASATSAASSGSVVLESKGYIIPAHQILVSPKVSGMIVTLNIEEGQQVKAGDVLAVIEDIEYRAEYDRAMAALKSNQERLRELENGTRPEEIKQAQAELEEAKAQLLKAEITWKRNKDLLARKALSQQEFDVSESEYHAMQRRVDRMSSGLKLAEEGPRPERITTARSEVSQTQAELNKAEWRLGNCTIKAPISGTILKKTAEEGNIVNPIAFNGSFALCEMADLKDLEVDLSIQERDISLVFKGQKCKVRSEAYPQRIYSGYVSRLMPIADRAKGAVPVRVKLSIPADEEGVYLKPEMGAIVTFLGKDNVTETSASGSDTTTSTKTEAVGQSTESAPATPVVEPQNGNKATP